MLSSVLLKIYNCHATLCNILCFFGLSILVRKYKNLYLKLYTSLPGKKLFPNSKNPYIVLIYIFQGGIGEEQLNQSTTLIGAFLLFHRQIMQINI